MQASEPCIPALNVHNFGDHAERNTVSLVLTKTGASFNYLGKLL